MGFAVSMPIVPLFLEYDLNVMDPEKLKMWVGVIQATAAVTMAVVSPIWGNLADVFSRRTMLMRAMFGGAVVMSLIGLAQSPAQLLILRTLQGCLTGTIAAATALASGITPEASMALTLGLLQTGVAVGNALGPLIGGVIADALGYRIAFFFTGVMLAAGGVIILFFVEDDKRPPKPALPGEKKKISLFPDTHDILSSAVLMTLLIVSFSIQAANTIAAPMLALIVEELQKVGMQAAGVAGSPKFAASATGIIMGVGAAFTALFSFYI
jgi:DHA1 family multidrug resistance protein-like MFS transporter